MRIFRTPPYRDEPELLDSPDGASDHDLEVTLRDIRRANIFGLGTWVIKRHLADLLRDHPKDKPLRILDLASGSGDIPEEICRWASRKGYDVSFVVTDISPAILEFARRRITKAGFGDRTTFAVCDATRPPFEAGAFDVTLCSLAFHHLNLAQAQESLRQMARLSRKGFIVNDIYRSRGAWYMARALTSLTTSNTLTRHDGPASVLRAYTPAELRRLSARSGVSVEIHTHPFWRVAVVGSGKE